MMDDQTELFPGHQSARAAAAAGIATAVRNASLQSEHWPDRARAYLTDYARDNSEFTTEEVRVWAREHAKPPLVTSEAIHPRAWGGIVRAAVKAGTIEDTGRKAWSKVRPAHAGYRTIWRSLITHAEAPALKAAPDASATSFHLSTGEGKVACGAHRRMRSAAARAALVPAENKRGVTCLRCKGTVAYERAK
jgi:hypothetical protein